MPKRGRPPADRQMRVRIQELVDRSLDTASIIKKVQQEYGKGASDRNIQREIAKAKINDDTPPWSPFKGVQSAEDVALLLPVVGAVAEATEGRRRVTEAQAKGLLEVRRVAPDMPPWVVFRLVLAWQRRRSEDKEDLDIFMGLAPWKDNRSRARYWRWVREHRPDWLMETVAGWYTPTVDGVILACDLLQSTVLGRPNEDMVTLLAEETLDALCDESRDVTRYKGSRLFREAEDGGESNA